MDSDTAGIEVVDAPRARSEPLVQQSIDSTTATTSPQSDDKKLVATSTSERLKEKLALPPSVPSSISSLAASRRSSLSRTEQIAMASRRHTMMTAAEVLSLSRKIGESFKRLEAARQAEVAALQARVMGRPWQPSTTNRPSVRASWNGVPLRDQDIEDFLNELRISGGSSRR
jgi:hypothetical protein